MTALCELAQPAAAAQIKRMRTRLRIPVPAAYRIRSSGFRVRSSAQQAHQRGLHRLAPDVVALRLRMQVVGPERIGQENALLVEELRADVEVEDVFLVV